MHKKRSKIVKESQTDESQRENNLRREWHADKCSFLASLSNKMVGVKLGKKINKQIYGNGTSFGEKINVFNCYKSQEDKYIHFLRQLKSEVVAY